jgi:hypothetical protein
MNTVLFTHGWLDCPTPGYACDQGCCCRRLNRFIEHYGDSWPIEVLDNGSARESQDSFLSDRMFDAPTQSIIITNAQPHYARGPDINGAASWDYKNVWRCYQYIRDELLPRYEKVIFLATDAYICSQRLVDYIEALDSGWTALWSAKYNFPATEIQVIVRGCKAFDDFFAGDPLRYNGLCEETTVPLTHVERGFVGDRYGETQEPYTGQDYYTQVSDSLDWDDNVFPILRRREGKVMVC